MGSGGRTDRMAVRTQLSAINLIQHVQEVYILIRNVARARQCTQEVEDHADDEEAEVSVHDPFSDDY